MSYHIRTYTHLLTLQVWVTRRKIALRLLSALELAGSIIATLFIIIGAVLYLSIRKLGGLS